MTTLKDMNKLATAIITSDKKRNQNIDSFLRLFVTSYNTDLNFNASPIDKIIKGLKKTDTALIKEWFAQVTNAKLYLNSKKNYVVKYNNAEDTTLTTTAAFETLTWYDLAKKAEVTIKDSYKDLEEAKKRMLQTLEKALNTAKNPEERETLIDFFKSQF